MRVFNIISILIALNLGYSLYIPFRRTTSQGDQQLLSFRKQDTIIRSDFDEWVQQQRGICIKGILNNIGGISSTLNTTEVSPGAVIASPSRNKPNYFYQWTRDAALTIKSLVLYLSDTNFEDRNIISIIESYIENNYYIQRLDNKSGVFDDEDKSGLGEPKYMTNGMPFNENWGRPQRDGPGLRAITILQYLHLLEKNNKELTSSFLRSPKFVYDEIVKPDLIYVIKNWEKEGFDLWEEINSIHLFTSLTQLRAIKDGINAAKQYDSDDKFIGELESTFDELKTFIEFDAGFKSNVLPHLIETPTLLKDRRRSGLDAAILLASIHSHNLELDDYTDIPFDINDNLLVNTLTAMVADMKYRYPINHNKLGFDNAIGVALGRYPEDVYDGYGTSEGNPWFISTASAAEIIYKLIYKINVEKQNIVIDSYNLDFYKQFLDMGDVNENFVITYGSPKFKALNLDLMKYSDSFLEIIKDHVDNEGHMSEQFNKYHGFMQGATDLTWSYSAVWNSFRWRDKSMNIIKDE